MTGIAGNFHTVALGRQTAKGTPQTTAHKKLKLIGGVVVPDWEVVPLVETDSSRQRSRTVRTGYRVAGAIEGYLRSDEFSQLAYGVMGANVTSGAGPYTHTATSAAGAPYYTLFPAYNSTTLVDRYVDCRFTQLSVRGTALGVLSYQATFAGLTATFGETDPVLAVSTATPLTYPNVTVTKGGSAAAVVSEFELNIDNGGEFIVGDTGLIGADYVFGRWAVDGRLVILFESDADWRLFHTGATGGTTAAGAVSTEALTILASANASSDEISFAMTNVEIVDYQVAPNPDGTPIRATYLFSSQPQATIANTLSIVTKNAVVSL